MVAFNGIPIETLSDTIHVLDVTVKTPTIKVSTFTPPTVDGLRKLLKTRQETKVSVSFEIFAIDAAERLRVLDAVIAWADGADDQWLEIDARPGRHLIATCVYTPNIDSLGEVSEPFKVEFEAYDPYWYDDSPTTMAVNVPAGTEYETEMIVGGNARECRLSFTVKNEDTSNLTSVNVKAGGYSVTVSGLTLTTNETLDVGYDANGLMYMNVNGFSVLDKRTDASSDDLILKQREANDIVIVTDASAYIVLSARGCSL